jgi:hypothetical protein
MGNNAEFNATQAEGMMEDAAKIFFNRKDFSIKQYRNWVDAGMPTPSPQNWRPEFYSPTTYEYHLIRTQYINKTKILSYP